MKGQGGEQRGMRGVIVIARHRAQAAVAEDVAGLRSLCVAVLVGRNWVLVEFTCHGNFEAVETGGRSGPG